MNPLKRVAEYPDDGDDDSTPWRDSTVAVIIVVLLVFGLPLLFTVLLLRWYRRHRASLESPGFGGVDVVILENMPPPRLVLPPPPYTGVHSPQSPKSQVQGSRHVDAGEQS